MQTISKVLFSVLMPTIAISLGVLMGRQIISPAAFVLSAVGAGVVLAACILYLRRW